MFTTRKGLLTLTAALLGAWFVFGQNPPATPNKPAQPAEPKKAAQPAEPKKPAEPVKPAQPEKGEKPAQPAAANPGLEKLKQLAGEWVETKEPAQAEPGGKPKIAAIYKVTAAGSVVHEMLFPGTQHEMVTMYHLDGPNLVLTHYCALGNQPRMKAEPSADANKLVFKFAGGTNLDPAKDAHMHDLTLTFIDADHIRAEWTRFEDGKKVDVTTLELKRQAL